MDDKYAKMDKTALRAACKAAGISYSGLNNDGMRDALRAKDAEFEASPEELAKQTGRKTTVDANLEETADKSPTPAPAAKPAKGKGAKAKDADRHTGNGLKIEKDREEKNGVKRPSAGGKCREIWDALDAIYQDEGDEKGVMPTSKMVRELAEREGWNPNNASIEFYQWRKFNGITGRQK